MDKKYWEKLAPVHQEEMFSVLHHDKKKIIKSYIEQYGGKTKMAVDMGCATGRWLPLLSRNFKKVMAVDISETFINMAKEKNARLTNIEYVAADAGSLHIPPADLVLCVNAVMTPSLATRDAFFKSISSSLKKNGKLILVVPSLESALYTESMLDWWHFTDNTEKPLSTGDTVRDKYHHLRSGIFDIDNVPTKHYLKEETRSLLPFYGLEVRGTHKIEYGWETEFEEPPVWMKKKPGPWDWLFIARKKA